MKIRITKKGLPKAQMWNSQVPSFIDWNKFLPAQPNVTVPFAPGFNPLAQPSINVPRLGADFAEADNFGPEGFNVPAQPKNTGLTVPTDIGIGPQRSQSEQNVQRAYDSNPQLARNYDFGVGRALVTDYLNPKGSTSKKQLLGYTDFLNNKYATETEQPTGFQKFARTMKDTGDTLKLGIGVGSKLVDTIDNRRRQRDFNTYLRNQLNTDALFAPVSGSRGDYVTTGSRFGEFRPDEYVVNRGMFAEEGGEYTQPMKIRITATPMESMEYGGQSNYGLDLGRRKVYTDMPESQAESVSSSISAVPRYAANVEAEGGETVLGDLDQDGGMEHMVIKGPRHSEGGVPLNLPEGSFIFSDTAKMRIKDPEVLKYFGLAPKKGGYTPAEIAKRYDINKYKAIMEDPEADDIAKSTAQLMVNNYNEKLGKLSLVQEGMKDFPQGIPQVAELAKVAYGGHIPAYNPGGETPSTTEEKERVLTKDYPWLKPWLKSNTKQGSISPTGKTTTYNDDVTNIYQNIKEWEKIAGRKFNSLVDLQGFVYSSLDQDDPSVIDKMWEYWGHTAKGKDLDVSNFADNIMGARTADLLKLRPKPVVPPVKKEETKQPPVTTQPNDFYGYNQPMPFGYMTPDVVNLAATALNPPKKYLPFRAPINLPTVSPTFYDPNREIAAQNEAANMLAQNAAAFGNPQAYMANAARLQGNLAEGVANTIGRVQNQNVGVANQFAGVNADIIGRENLLRAQRANDLFDANVIANQQFDNSRRQYNQNVAKAYGQAWNNRMNLGLVNAVNPFFNIDNVSGRSIFKSGYGPQDLGGGNSTSSSSVGNYSAYDKVPQIKAELMRRGLSEAKAEDRALRIVEGGVTSATDTDMDGFPNRVSTTRRGTPMNYLSQIAEMYRNNLQEMGGMVYPF